MLAHLLVVPFSATGFFLTLNLRSYIRHNRYVSLHMLKDSAGTLADRANLGLLFPEHRVYFHGAPALTVPADLYCIITKVFLLLHSASVLLFLFRFDVERLILLYDHAALLHDLLAGIILAIGQQLILGWLLLRSNVIFPEALE